MSRAAEVSCLSLQAISVVRVFRVVTLNAFLNAALNATLNGARRFLLTAEILFDSALFDKFFVLCRDNLFTLVFNGKQGFDEHEEFVSEEQEQRQNDTKPETEFRT